MVPNMIFFDPPLLNSANPWATTQEGLQALYDCPYTGAVTTRTITLHGFQHDDSTHQYCFFDGNHNLTKHSSSNHANESSSLLHPSEANGTSISSLNTLGYSPLPLAAYIPMLPNITANSPKIPGLKKPFILSVTGSAPEVVECFLRIRYLESLNSLRAQARLLMEINLSCPNIQGRPPPAYSKDQLSEYLRALRDAMREWSSVPVGIKTPPYTHQAQFDDLIFALLESAQSAPHGCPISFITATNTLGNCLVLPSSGDSTPALSSADSSGLGGLAGAALHPLALGNVRKIGQMLDAHEELKHIAIIGVGGVSDAAGYKRMRSVGADAVAVGTALGNEGVAVFEKIIKGL